MQDQVTGVAYLATLPYVDPARIGIFGWSYGCYMTLVCMARAPDLFVAGAAVALLTDWRFYDTHYTEQFMGHPEDNAAGYEDSSVLAHIENLRRTPRGALLLVHGMADDHVLFQNSVLLIEARQQARIAFDLMAYPAKKHGIRGKAARTHLFKMILAHRQRYLC